MSNASDKTSNLSNVAIINVNNSRVPLWRRSAEPHGTQRSPCREQGNLLLSVSTVTVFQVKLLTPACSNYELFDELQFEQQ